MPARRPSASAPGLGPLLFECARLLDDIAQAEVNREAGAPVRRANRTAGTRARRGRRTTA